MIWPFRAKSPELARIDALAIELAQARAKRMVAQASLMQKLAKLENESITIGVTNGKGKEGYQVAHAD